MTHASLTWERATHRPDLLADPTVAALRELTDQDAVSACAIDPDIADTATLVEESGYPLQQCANCVIVAGRRGGEERVAAVVVLAHTRADVNGVVRKLLDVRKLSFMSQDDAVSRTGMEYGGISPLGLPADWPIYVDAAVAASGVVMIGSGVRRSKLELPGALLATLPGAQVVDGLARPVG